MSGHSKWASIKHKKGKEDAKRGRVFGKISRAITVCVREGGKDPGLNPGLATLLQKARDFNMPQDNIERAVKRGTGELSGAASYETILYEGYGSSGVALIVQAMTDNRNRAAADMRNIFSKHGGNLGEAGCVSWMFERKGLILVRKNQKTEEEVLELAVEAGADDLNGEGEQWAITTEPAALMEVRGELEDKGLEIESAEITMYPKNLVVVESEAAAQRILRLIDGLEEHDDVQEVYANFDIPDDVLEAIGSA